MFKSRFEKREYESLYVDLCSRVNIDDIEGKEIFVIYDEILPDLYVSVDVNGKHIKSVNYDIYARRLKSIKIKFPSGAVFIYNIVRVIERERYDSYYNVSWEEPMIALNVNGLEIEVSLIDLIGQGIKIYLNDYSFDKEYLNE